MLECIIPILGVTNLAASLGYYVDVLAFTIDWGGTEGSTVASVSRDGRAIMLCEGGQGHHGTWIWIGAEDIEPLLAEFTRKGASILEGPINYSWAYEMRIAGPDRHVLRFGSEPRTDLPFSDGADR